jgi:hypothetical protein
MVEDISFIKLGDAADFVEADICAIGGYSPR